MKKILTDFAIGFIAGFFIAAVIFGIVAGAVHYRNKDRERIEYVELHQEIEALREDVINLTADELLDLPDIRAAADGATAELLRKRDEALQRLRDRKID
jgi:hypothetical protein